MLIDTSSHRFPQLPIYITSLTIANDHQGKGLRLGAMGGEGLSGGGDVYEPFADKFTFYLDQAPASAVAVASAQDWSVNYIAYIPTKAQLARLKEGRQVAAQAKMRAEGKGGSGSGQTAGGTAGTGGEAGGLPVLALVFDLSMARQLPKTAPGESSAKKAEDDLRGWESIVAASVSDQQTSAAHGDAHAPSLDEPLNNPPWALLRMAIAGALAMDPSARSINSGDGGFDLSVPVLVRHVCKIRAAMHADLSFGQESLGVQMQVAVVFPSGSHNHFALLERHTALRQLKAPGFNGFLARQLREHGVGGLTAADLVIARPQETSVRVAHWVQTLQKSDTHGRSPPLRCPTADNLREVAAGEEGGVFGGLSTRQEQHDKRAAIAGITAAASTLANELGFRVIPTSTTGGGSLLDPRLSGSIQNEGRTSGATIVLTSTQAIGLFGILATLVAVFSTCAMHASFTAMYRSGERKSGDADPLFASTELSPMAPKSYGGGYAGYEVDDEPTGTDYHF
jgi:hypothetical protein